MKDIVEIRRSNLQRWIDHHHNGVQAEFVNVTGINQGELSALLRNKSFGERKARNLERQANMPYLYLDQDDEFTIPSIPIIKGAVPLISWVAAGSWTSPCDEACSYEPEQWIPCPVKHGNNTFALVVSGISMSNPEGKPSYESGDIIFVDPEVEPHNKDCVIVRQTEDAKATFKQIIYEDGDTYLRPLNPNWPEKIIKSPITSVILGTVIGKWVGRQV